MAESDINQTLRNKQWSAQGSITIKRLRNGDHLYLVLNNETGKPLYQSVDFGNNNAIAPDWTVDANRPVIVPSVTSAMGAAVEMTNPGWQYNGVSLIFSGATSAGWKLDSTGKFAKRLEDHAIKPMANLADPAHLANGILTFNCMALSGGGSYEMSKAADIILQRGGSSGYYAALTTTNMSLDRQNPKSTITAALFLGGIAVEQFYVKWRRDGSVMAANDGLKSITVTRSGVDGTQLYVAEFYPGSSAPSAGATPVAVAGITIIDAADTYQVRLEITSAKQEIAKTGDQVTVKASLIDTSGAPAPGNVRWRLDVIDPQTFSSLKSSNTDTINVTSAETDRIVNGVAVISDVEVIADSNWGVDFAEMLPETALPELYYREAANI